MKSTNAAAITLAQQGQELAQALNLDELGRRFTAYIDTDSADTVKTYRAAVKRLLAYFAAQGITRPCREDVRAYRDSLKAEGLKPASVNLYLTGARLFFQWLVTEGAYSENIAERVKAAKLDRSDSAEGHRKAYLKKDELAGVMATAQGESLKDIRDRAIIALMATAGLRCIEVARANNGDIEELAGKHYIYIQGKGRTEKGAPVEISATVLAAIRNYQQARGTADDDAPLFTDLPSNARQGGERLATGSISRMVKGRFRAAGIDDERHTAHSLRHTAGTMAYRQSRNVAATKQYMRHTNINTTMIYIHDVEREENQMAEQVAAALLG